MNKTREAMLKLGALVGVELEGGEKFDLDKDAPCREPGVNCLECRGCWGCHFTWRCPNEDERQEGRCNGKCK